MALSVAGDVDANTTTGVSVAQASSEHRSSSEAGTENRSADAWFGFCSALVNLKSSSLSSSTTSSTATTEASLSEVGSSHGGLSPRPAAVDGEAEASASAPSDASRTTSSGKSGSAAEAKAVQEGEPAEFEPPSSPSGRSRRARRRRRTRGGGRGGVANHGIADAEGFGPIDEEFSQGGSPSRHRSARDVVVLSDLCLGLESPGMSGGCPSPSKLPSAPAQADLPGSPCRARPGPGGIMSTSLTSPLATMTAVASDASARVPAAPSPLLLASSEVAWTNPSSPCRTRASPFGIVSTSPCTGPATFTGEASTRSLLGVGAQSPCSATQPAQSRLQELAPSTMEMTPPASNSTTEGSYSTMLSSPCRARAAPTGGIVSTLPVIGQGPSSPAGMAAAGAGSRSADTLRSWLHASGLPSAADVVAQLQAAVPESYED
mmetsp:Transcript_44597/g.83758  ORF Transcript_44597/g.83758 Transcript_44597/m.83758 type:complete len:433 (-) Transcript_44597:81-1379(-)